MRSKRLPESGDRAVSTSRRTFIGGALATGAAVAWGLGEGFPAAAAGPRIVVVGGGLAGLTCAYQLKSAGYSAQIYEASDRIGGRCWSLKGFFNEGQVAEHGGELIDQGHTAIRQLAQSLGLKLENLLRAEQNGTEPRFYFDGMPYTFTEATNDLKGIWQKIKSDVQAASYPTLYTLSTQRGRELDHMSIVDWINESVPGGMSSRVGQLLAIAYNIEYGAEPDVQSSLNLLYLLGYAGQGQLRIFGPSNEKYHVEGGNDRITERLADRLAGQINLGSPLTGVTRRARWNVQAHVRPGRQDPASDRRSCGAGAAVLDPAAASTSRTPGSRPSSCVRSANWAWVRTRS